MEERRRENGKIKIQKQHLCSGPAKLCQSLSISREAFNKVDLLSSDEIFLEGREEEITESDIMAAPRINIAYAEEWASAPLRFCWKKYEHFLSYPLPKLMKEM
jgi:DNA-3-methyladenine glycosylase